MRILTIITMAIIVNVCYTNAFANVRPKKCPSLNSIKSVGTKYGSWEIESEWSKYYSYNIYNNYDTDNYWHLKITGFVNGSQPKFGPGEIIEMLSEEAKLTCHHCRCECAYPITGKAEYYYHAVAVSE